MPSRPGQGAASGFLNLRPKWPFWIKSPQPGTVAAGVAVTGAADLTGAGSSTSDGLHAGIGVAALAGLGSSTSAGTHAAIAAAALAGNGTLTTNGTRVRFGFADLTGTGTSTTTGYITTSTATALTGTGALTASGAVSYTGAAHLTGTGTLTATAASDRRRGGRLLFVSEPVWPKTEFGSVDLPIAFGRLTATGVVHDVHPRAHLSGHGWLTASGGKPISDQQLIEELETLLLTL